MSEPLDFTAHVSIVFTPMTEKRMVPPEPVHGTFAGRAVAASADRVGQEATEFRLRVFGRLPISTRVHFLNETDTHINAKSWGIAVEPQAEDPDFDRNVYVESSDDRCAVPLLLSPSLRKKIQALVLDLPKAVVVIGPYGTDVAILRHAAWGIFLTPKAIAMLLERAIAIHDLAVLALEEHGHLGPRRDTIEADSLVNECYPCGTSLPGDPVSSALTWITIPLFLIGIMNAGATCKREPLAVTLGAGGLPLAMAVTPFYVLGIFLLVRGRSRSYKSFYNHAILGGIGLFLLLAFAFTVRDGSLVLRDIPPMASPYSSPGR